MFQNRLPFARKGATGAVLVLMLALVTQFTMTPAALATCCRIRRPQCCRHAS